MCNLSEGIYERGIEIGRILTLADCVQDGEITLERATEIAGMSVEEFLQKVEEYKKRKT